MRSEAQNWPGFSLAFRWPSPHTWRSNIAIAGEIKNLHGLGHGAFRGVGSFFSPPEPAPGKSQACDMSHGARKRPPTPRNHAAIDDLSILGSGQEGQGPARKARGWGQR